VNKVFVGSLSWNTGNQELRDFFSQVGEVEDARVITDRETGRSRGFGFVTFTNSDDANAAVQKLDNVELDGRTIKVNIAEERRRDNNNNSNRGHQGRRERW
jgi:cold-inducible RNA-binding protein